ncbi:MULTISPECIES: DUF4183 domain-containing protein [unclassified Lysinibacillus]|uniref:DUF4183 domain-containing protein n=1 Tax=unclassified Lysinibacillus TaxID=2636778 RepID=UPI0011712F48|nr:DUF4183 domain-containing protein [Lysinibacillus sp. CD3-6]QPQ36333.1 DUF4183 domain-containing protein [Lysinibacillus sp. JNUCC-52]UED82011.1 DUF4183 domain-containing protein [Lysinibacillus sp. CD3-6]
MALSIININVNVSSTSTRFFNILATPLAITDGTTLAATTFLTDSGTAATAFPIIINGYYNLYINGVLQEGDAYSISSTELTFNIVTASIAAGTPIIIEAVELSTII